MIRILSFGAGVQSTALLRMSLDGVLPLIDHVIFADTGAELPATYENVEMMHAICTQRGVGFHRVTTHRNRSKGNIETDLLTTSVFSEMSAPPFYLRHKSGQVGQMMRQCTSDYKTDAIRRKFNELVGVPPGGRGPKEIVAEEWLGIHSGEKRRMKESKKRWFKIVHPLIELVPMNNGDCVAWLESIGYPVPPKSACYFCPFQSDRRWSSLPDEFHDRSETLEKSIQANSVGHLEFVPYLHRSCLPIKQAIKAIDRQSDLDFFGDECSGVCGV